MLKTFALTAIFFLVSCSLTNNTKRELALEKVKNSRAMQDWEGVVEAADEYRSYEGSESPWVLFTLGESYYRLGDKLNARINLKEYLKTGDEIFQSDAKHLLKQYHNEYYFNAKNLKDTDPVKAFSLMERYLELTEESDQEFLDAQGLYKELYRLRRLAWGTQEFKDPRDGQTYRSVKIGPQRWMAENLNYRTKNSWCYSYSEKNCQRYGRLYTWSSALKSCPEGWRIPTNNDWDVLVESLIQKTGLSNKKYNHYTELGRVLKSKSMNGSDDFGFSGLPAGDRNVLGEFNYLGHYIYWWSSTEEDCNYVSVRKLHTRKNDFTESDSHKDLGHSVRCIEDD